VLDIDRLLRVTFQRLIILVENWIVLYAIDDLVSIPNNFRMFNVNFFKFDKTSQTDWPILNSKRLDPIITTYYLDKICGSTEIEADTEDNALSKGMNKIETALNAMRTFKTDRELRKPLNSLVKNVRTGVSNLALHAAWHRDKCAGWNYDLNQDELTRLKNASQALETLVVFNTSDMVKRIFRALRWAAMATQETQPEDKILKFTTSIECLFIKEWGGKAKLAGERVARFWTDDNSKRDTVYDDIKRFYNLRNKIVHGGDFTISSSDEAKMNFIVRNLVFKVAEEVSSRSLLTFDSFLTYIETIGTTTWTPPSA
jgi:hypothetical protein